MKTEKRIEQRITEINTVIAKLKEERTMIRETICKHEKFTIKWWSDYPGHRYEAKVCDVCGHNLGCAN